MEVNILKKMSLDTIGIGASLLCAVHCALLPLLLTVLPLMGSHVLENEQLEYALLSFSFGIGCWSLGRGYFRQHRRITPLLIFTAGFALLLGGHFGFAGGFWEPVIIFAGAAGVTGAHILNLQRCRQCNIRAGGGSTTTPAINAEQAGQCNIRAGGGSTTTPTINAKQAG